MGRFRWPDWFELWCSGDPWCVLICTFAEVVRSNSTLALAILLFQCYDMHLNALQLDHVRVWWHSSFLNISYCGPTSQPCRLVPTVRSPPSFPICQVVDLSLPVPSARSPYRGPTCHLVWPLANQHGISLESWNLSNTIISKMLKPSFEFSDHLEWIRDLAFRRAIRCYASDWGRDLRLYKLTVAAALILTFQYRNSWLQDLLSRWYRCCWRIANI